MTTAPNMISTSLLPLGVGGTCPYFLLCQFGAPCQRATLNSELRVGCGRWSRHYRPFRSWAAAAASPRLFHDQQVQVSRTRPADVQVILKLAEPCSYQFRCP